MYSASVDRKGCCGVGKADPTTTLKLSRDVYVFDLLSLLLSLGISGM